MAWSTREVAELAGTSLRTVRHYHEVGLLETPRRGTNGYKQYGVAHLVQLVRIRRLVDLGFTLTQISELPVAEDQGAEAMRLLDAQLTERILELERARAEVAELLRTERRDPVLGTDIAPTVDEALTDPDRAFLVVLSRVASPEVLDAYRSMLHATHDDPVLADLDALAPDADTATRTALAVRMAAHIEQVHDSHPILRDTAAGAPLGRAAAARVLQATMEEIYNPAQLDVMRRAAAAQGAPTAR